MESINTSGTHATSLSEKNSLLQTLSTAEPAPPPYSIVAPTSDSLAEPIAGSSRQPSEPVVDVQPTRRPSAGLTSNPSGRRSLFLPHPNAPKPAQSPAGPMYGRQAVAPLQIPIRPEGPPPGSSFHSLNLVLAARREGRLGRMTIYGNFDRDLASSLGPVPVTFSVEPPPHSSRTPSRAATMRDVRSTTPSNNHLSPGQPQIDSVVEDQPLSPTKSMPRANFFPKGPTARPRSRSFSGFDKPIAEMFLPEKKRYHLILLDAVKTRADLGVFAVVSQRVLYRKGPNLLQLPRWQPQDQFLYLTVQRFRIPHLLRKCRRYLLRFRSPGITWSHRPRLPQISQPPCRTLAMAHLPVERQLPHFLLQQEHLLECNR